MIKLYTPKHRASDKKAYNYVTDSTFEWEQRSYISDNDAFFVISQKNNLSWDGANSEAYLDDILVADSSVRNPMYARNGERVAYGYIPFILENGFTTAIYDTGFLFYDNPTDRAAEAVAGAGGYTYYNFADNASAASDWKGNANHGGGKFNAYGADSIGMFVIGVMAGTQWNLKGGTEAAALMNLRSATYWAGVGYGSLSIDGGSSRVILAPQQYQDARVWWENDSAWANMNELGMDISGYRIKHWRDGGWRGSFVNRGVSPAPALTDSFRIPSNGCIWGYLTITVTDRKTLNNQVRVGGNEFLLVNHGKWTPDHLAASTDILKTGVIEPWNANGTTSIPSRLWRYGLHVVAKKE